MNKSKTLTSAHRPNFRLALLAPRFWPTWLALFLLLACSILPWRARAWLGDQLSKLLLRADSKRKFIAGRNLELCFPELTVLEREELLKRHIRALCHLVLSFGTLLWGSYERLSQRFDIYGEAQLSMPGHERLILLTPHTIAMEFLAQWLPQKTAVVAVARLHTDHALLDWLVYRSRTRFGGAFTGHEESLVALVKAVRSGHRLFHLPDEDLGNNQGYFVPFFNVPKATHGSLGRLAKLCGAKVMPLGISYCPDSQRFSVTFGAPQTEFSDSSGELTARMTNRAIENILATDPAQYVWYTKIFRSRPEGANSVYG